MQDREAYEKWSVLLAHINIIYAQTGFFVKTTSFSMQDFGYSSNLLRRVAVQIFRADRQIFRSFFHPTNIQNPAWFVRRDRFRGPTHEQWSISRMITSQGGFACTERDRRTPMRTETVKSMISRYFCCVFFTTGRSTQRGFAVCQRFCSRSLRSAIRIPEMVFWGLSGVLGRFLGAQKFSEPTS